MFDYTKKDQNPQSRLGDAFLGGISGEGRLTGVNRFRHEMEKEYQAEQEEKTKMKNEMKSFKTVQQVGKELEEHYMECFPTYAEDDYQISVKDNLSKRPPGNAHHGKSLKKKK
jgi:hypothetical protein